MSAAAWNQWKIHHTASLLFISGVTAGGDPLTFTVIPLTWRHSTRSPSFIFRQRREALHYLKNLLGLNESAAACVQRDLNESWHVAVLHRGVQPANLQSAHTTLLQTLKEQPQKKNMGHLLKQSCSNYWKQLVNVWMAGNWRPLCAVQTVLMDHPPWCWIFIHITY